MDEMKRVTKEMNDKLEEERSELNSLKALNSFLVEKERQSRDEIQGAVEELIKVFRDLSCHGSTVRVKRVGEMDQNPFFEACKQRFGDDDMTIVWSEQDKLVTKWEDTIKDPHWHPFKRDLTETIMKEFVDEENDKLKNLKQEWGEDVMNAVKTALEELNEFNPSGRSAVPVLWNFEHDRKATLKEAIAHIAQQIKHLKRTQT